MALELYIDTDNLIKITDLKDEDGAIVTGATVKLSLFKDVALKIETSYLAFTSGGVGEPEVGDVLKGATGGAVAEIAAIVVTSGTWAGGDAVGRISILNQIGAFETEDLNQVDGQDNIASITADSTGAETANAGSKTTIGVRNHGLIDNQWIHIQGTKNYDGTQQVHSIAENKITISKAYVAEKFSGDETVFVGLENGCNIGMADDGGGEYSGVLPETIVGLVNNDWYSRLIEITKDTSTLTINQKVRATYYLETGSE